MLRFLPLSGMIIGDGLGLETDLFFILLRTPPADFLPSPEHGDYVLCPTANGVFSVRSACCQSASGLCFFVVCGLV